MYMKRLIDTILNYENQQKAKFESLKNGFTKLHHSLLSQEPKNQKTALRLTSLNTRIIRSIEQLNDIMRALSNLPSEVMSGSGDALNLYRTYVASLYQYRKRYKSARRHLDNYLDE